VPYIENAKPINVCTFYVESNPVVKRSVHATYSTLSQTFCGNSLFLTVNHNVAFLGYNNTHLHQHKIFGPFHDVITQFHCILFGMRTYLLLLYLNVMGRVY